MLNKKEPQYHFSLIARTDINRFKFLGPSSLVKNDSRKCGKNIHMMAMIIMT